MLETQTVQTVHTLENNQLINALELASQKSQQFIQKQKDLQRELTNTKKRKGDNTTELNRLTAAMKTNEREIDETRRAYIKQAAGMKESEMTGKSLKDTLKLLRYEQDSLGRSSEAYTRNMKEQARVQGELTARSSRGASANGFFGEVRKNIPAAVAGAVGGLVVGGVAVALDGIVSSVGRVIDISAKLSDQQADIRKTTGLTAAGVDELEKSLKSLDTRTKREDLRSLAAEAGKLGMTGVEDIAKFVEEADKIKVALGEDLGEDAIIQLGKISNAFGVEMINMGSAINAIGADSEASEQFLVNFTARLAGTAVTAKVSAPDILGYGAVLDSLGLQVEMSSTALSNFFIDFVKDSGKFEKAAGMTGGSLKKLIGEKGTNEGFVSFLENLKSSSKSSEDFLKKLEQIGIDGSRGATVFLTLANNVAMVKDQQKLANEEYTKGTSILDEFNIKNNNTAAVLEKLGKWWSSFVSNGAVKGFVDSIVFGFAKLIGIVTEADMATQKFFDKKKEFEQNEKSLNSLMGRHDELKEKTILSADEQGELKTVISQITALVPGAGTAFDQYGNALDINRGKVNEFIKVQKQLLLFNNKEAIQLTENEISEKDKQLKKLNREIQSGKQLRVTTGTGGGGLYEATLTGSELQAYEAQRRQINQELVDTKARLDGLRGDFLEISSPNATPSRSTLSAPRTNTAVTDPAKPLIGGTTTTADVDKGGEAEAQALANKLRKEEQQLIELRAELALQEQLQYADDFDKKILIEKAAHEKKIRQVKTQFSEEKTITAQQQQIINAEKILAEREYTEKVTEITKEFTDKQKEQIEAAQGEAAKLVVESRIAALTREIEDAEGSKELENMRDKMLQLSFLQEAQAIADVEAEYAKKVKANEGNAEALIQIEKNKQEALNQVAMEYSNARLVIVEDSNEDIAKAQEEATKKLFEDIELISGYFLDALNSIVGIMNAISERQLQAAERRADAELTTLENKRNSGILTEEQYAAAKVNLEEKTNEELNVIRRKQAQREKAQAIATSIIDTALATLKALRKPPGPPTTIPFAIAAGALGALQTAAIAAQPIPYYSGGFTQNNTHAATLGEHGQEYVIPNWLMKDPMVFDTVKLIERKRSINSPYQATNTTAAPTFSPSSSAAMSSPGAEQNRSQPAQDAVLTATLLKLIQKLDQPIEAYWQDDSMKRYTDRMQIIKRESMR
jgi:TP901 family phage tail tape measure protein